MADNRYETSRNENDAERRNVVKQTCKYYLCRVNIASFSVLSLSQILEALDSAERHEQAKYGAVVVYINDLISTYNAQGRFRKTLKQNEAVKANPAPVAAV